MKIHLDEDDAPNVTDREVAVQIVEAIVTNDVMTVGNFVLVHFDGSGVTAPEADDYLIARGFILRRVAGYGFPNALRMTIGSEEANRGVLAALKELLGH